MAEIFMPAAATDNEDGSLGVIVYTKGRQHRFHHRWFDFLWWEKMEFNGHTGRHRRKWSISFNKWRWDRDRELQPGRCARGRHRKMDIVNIDGSITHGECTACHAVTDPHRPSGPSQENVDRWQEWNNESRRLKEMIETYEMGGPCWECNGKKGAHEPGCFVSEDDDD